MRWETVAICAPSVEKPVLLLTDVNSRTGSSQVESQQRTFARISSDPEAKTNTRGRTILDECDAYGLVILNGTLLETASPGRFTSWQPGGSSVIDYAIASKSLLPQIQKLHIESPTLDPDDDWSHYSRICITLDADIFKINPPAPDMGVLFGQK
jgi:hypothetical protein